MNGRSHPKRRENKKDAGPVAEGRVVKGQAHHRREGRVGSGSRGREFQEGNKSKLSGKRRKKMSPLDPAEQ